MSGVSRFLSRRDKRSKGDEKAHHHPHYHHATKDLYRVFYPEDSKKKTDKDEEKKVKAILSRLEEHNIHDLRDVQVEYALRSKSANGDPDKAFELLMLFEDALQGAIKDPDRKVKLSGAENRELVTCYLDSLLFAMYARLDSFEQILTVEYSDAARKKLVTMLRLWVNMLRNGNLITTDITKHLQEALGACGWQEATKLHQQDVSEAFTFITGKLDLPLLTLKMDVYHTGKEDADDHRIVRERLLEVAIPPPPEDGSKIKLEDCLEAYFNNKIEVKRHLQRRNTLQSLRSFERKAQVLQVETVELRSSSPSSATPFTPSSSTSSSSSPFSSQNSINPHRRADSIFSERRVEVGEQPEKRVQDDFSIGTRRPRAETIRREVLMPAWQFFSLIPWHTAGSPKNDVQVAHHFSTKRPVLGICLKRYSISPQGIRSRLNTYIDIPLEIGLPHFISDDSAGEFGSNFTNFKLSLQSVVCHRGNSLDSGHYIALIRSDPPKSTKNIGTGPTPNEELHKDAGATDDSQANEWLRFDDLAPERVIRVDVKRALCEECPYLLFYQVQPIDEDLFRGDPPSYESIIQPNHSSNPTTMTPNNRLSSKNPNSSDVSNVATISTTEVGNPSSDPSQSTFVAATGIELPDKSSTSEAIDTRNTKTNLTRYPTHEPPSTVIQIPSLELTRTKTINTASLQSSFHSHLRSATAAAADGMDIRDTAPDSHLAARPHSVDLFSPMNSASLAHGEADPADPRTSMSSAEEGRSTLTFTDTTNSINGSAKGGSSAPITPGDEARSAYMSAAVPAGTGNGGGAGWMTAQRNSRSWRNALREKGSRSSSQPAEGRLSFGMTRLRNAMSRDKLGLESGKEGVDDTVVQSDGVAHGRTSSPDKAKAKAGGPIKRAKSLKTGKKGVRSLSRGREVQENGERPDRECVVM